MKKCTKCNLLKTEEHFSWKTKNKLKQSRCKSCHSEYRHEHYLRNKERYLAKAYNWNIIYRKRNQDYILNYLSNHACVDCDESDIRVLEFDHENKENKCYEVSDLVRASYSIETIQKEIQKCEIRCANCHRKRTSKQFNWYRNKGR